MMISRDDSLYELIYAERVEIAKYRCLESEKAGRDIGWRQAFEDWLQFHFPNWVRQEKYRVIEDHFHAQEVPFRKLVTQPDAM